MRQTASFGSLRALTLFMAVLTMCTKATPAKPACDPREPCKVGFLGLEFCSCPNGQRCPSAPESTISYENVKYHFCEPTVFHECAEDEVAWVRRGLRQTVYCTCPAPLRLISETWDTHTDTTQYKCSQQRVCRTPDDACMVRNRVFVGTKTVSLLKTLCQCADEKQCKETGHTVQSRTVELQQDVFRCVENNETSMNGEEEYEDEEYEPAGSTNTLQK